MATYESSGTLTTETKKADGMANSLEVVATVPTDTSITVTVKQDKTGGTTADASESKTVEDGTNSYDLSSFAANGGSTYWLVFDISTSDTSVTPSVDDATLSVGEYLIRFAGLSGDGSTTNERSINRPRAATLSGEGAHENTREITRPRSATLAGDGSLSNTRQPITKSRSATLAGDGELSNQTVFRETFPSELTRDLDWDFNFEREGFESSWLYQTGSDGAGSVALYIEGTFSDQDPCTPTAVIDYDADGDGTVDERSTARPIPATEQVVVFPELSGGDGYYRILLRDLRPADILVAVTFGPTHT
jgi:hypothetical protein